MTEQERIDAIAQQCRKWRYPPSLEAAITGYLSGQGTLEQTSKEWQAAKESKRRHLYPIPIILSEPTSKNLDALDLRILNWCIASEYARQFLHVVLYQERFDQAHEHLLSRGVDEQQLLTWLLEMLYWAVDQNGQPTSLGQRLLAYLPGQFDEMLRLVEERIPHGGYFAPAFMRLLVAAQPPYLDLAWQLAQKGQHSELPYYGTVGQCARVLLKADPARFTPWVREVASSEDPVNAWSRVVALQALLEQDVARHIDLAVAAARAPVPSKKKWNYVQYQLAGLEAAYKFDPVKYWPMVEDVALSRDYQLGQLALKLLGGASFDQARPVLQRCVASAPIYTALPALELLLKQPWEGQQAYVLSLLAHRTRHIQERSSKWLAAQGETIIDEIAPYLTHGSADTRLSAVQTLQRLRGARIQSLLAARLDCEKSQRVREAILDAVGVPKAGATAQGTHLAPIETITAEAEAALKYLPRPALVWFNVQKVRAPHWASGATVSPDVLRYLLYHQSRVERKDVLGAWVSPVLPLFDHSTTGDLALALFRGWISSGTRSEEAWLLPLIGALGDERLAQRLRQRAEEWGLGNRRVLAAQTIQALGRLENDTAQAELKELAKVFTHGRLKVAVTQALAHSF